MDRRFFLKSGSLLLGSSLLPRWVWAAAQSSTETLKGQEPIFVFIVQRGAMDGLSLLAPVADPEYFKLRPNIAIKTVGTKDHFAIDSHFALHPAAAALQPIWKEGTLSFVVQSGSMDGTRSHFDAQDYLENGVPGSKTVTDGFLSRALPELSHPGALSAVAMQLFMPKVLQGNSLAISMNSLKDYSLKAPFENTEHAVGNFEAMYQSATNKVLRETGISAFHSMHDIQDSTAGKGFNEYLKQFPKSTTGRRLGEIAWMITTGMGVQIAVTDIGGWDTHVYQGSNEGRLADRIRELSEAMAAFKTVLGAHWSRVVMVTATEFGRTVAENGTQGTDHGHGSVMMISGGRVHGGRVLGSWSELKKQNLYEERDVPVTTDFRQVFSEVLKSHLGIKDMAKVFPHWNNSHGDLRIFRS
ncbi:MAG TPA: DUF1501 domain-containing protein [Bdellovibrio sp.]|uniref:DUF1501 domain-containing protein n=1 Tax=Bdellovibrio sp. TaxID=28201 RepID=UPI002EE28052